MSDHLPIAYLIGHEDLAERTLGWRSEGMHEVTIAALTRDILRQRAQVKAAEDTAIALYDARRPR
jgi:hypothetical protein